MSQYMYQTVGLSVKKTENTISDSARLDIQELGGILLRNNSGVDTSRARPVRYGWGNDSPQINKVRKSPDLIGVVPVAIMPHHVGMTLGVFIGVEAKKEGWKYSPNDVRSKAQNNCLTNTINARGGCGFFLNDSGILVPHIKNVLKIT